MFNLIGKYVTESDTGERFIVHEYQEFLEVQSKTGTDHIPGMKELKLSDGSRVTPIDLDFPHTHWKRTDFENMRTEVIGLADRVDKIVAALAKQQRKPTLADLAALATELQNEQEFPNYLGRLAPVTPGSQPSNPETAPETPQETQEK